MDRSQTLETYDEEYARTYDERFLSHPRYRRRTEFELGVIGGLLDDRGTWLDVACGTGYHLSRFPGVARAGIDLSPAALAVARKANPDAIFLREGDFTEEIPEWEGKWSVTTCLWYSYGLVESVADVRRVIRNLASWTAEGGACFVPICDPELLGRRIRVPYRHNGVGIPPGDLLVTGVSWTWIEPSGKRHENQIAPPVEHMLEMFREDFGAVELVDYPRSKWWSRRRIRGAVARKRSMARRA